MKTNNKDKTEIFIDYVLVWLKKIQDPKNFTFFAARLGGFGHDFYSYKPKNSGVNEDYWNLVFANLSMLSVWYYKNFSTNIKQQSLYFINAGDLQEFIKFLKDNKKSKMPSMPTTFIPPMRELFWQIWYLIKMIENENV